MTSNGNLPTQITRPLYTAAGALVLFLVGVTLWASFAPLATSIPLTGQIVSSRPGFDLQHPYGGQVEAVFVAKHDKVSRGQPLLRFDSRLDRTTLASLAETKTRIRAENQVIDAILSGNVERLEHLARKGGAQYMLRHVQADLQQVQAQQSARSMSQQLEALRGKAEHDRGQLRLMQVRAERQESLVTDGIISRVDSETLEGIIMRLEGDVLSGTAEIFALEERLEQSRQEQELIGLSLRTELEAVRNTNMRQLADLRQTLATLKDRIARSEVVSPISGTVTEIFFAADGMYATRGATLVSLAQPLDTPHVAFRVPTNQIDQLRPGMTGRLVIPSLPQRAMPKMDVTITAISPKAETDEAGAPVGYSGRANLSQSAMEDLRAAFGDDFVLTADMPVSLMVEGRSTTMVQYLIAPFWAAFNTALQD